VPEELQQQIMDVNAAAPAALDKVVGQRGVVEQVKVGLEAAWMDRRRFDHALLVGPPGTGKSLIASVIAKELGGGLHEVLGQTITTPADLNALLLGAADKDVVFIDEVHELDPAYQTALYRAIDERKLFLMGRGRGAQTLAVADFTLLLATTDEFHLLQPLRDRMRLTLRFDYYTGEELAAVVAQRAHALRWPVGAEAVAEIASRGRGTPRLALRLLESARRVCRSEGAGVVTPLHVERACQLEQLDALGLDPLEQRYMRILSETAGPTRLNVLAARLGLPSRTISHVLEPYLLRAALIDRTDAGRELTARGREHLVGNQGE
jgi:Holliday junction DNA helicase RuvB